MTFVSPEFIAVESRPIIIWPDASKLVAKKISQRELELADFNWAKEYSYDNALTYLQKPYTINFVVEVRLTLDMQIVLNRETIYKRCYEALNMQEALLTKSHYIEDVDPNKTNYILCFDSKSAA